MIIIYLNFKWDLYYQINIFVLIISSIKVFFLYNRIQYYKNLIELYKMQVWKFIFFFVGIVFLLFRIMVVISKKWYINFKKERVGNIEIVYLVEFIWVIRSLEE